MRKLIFFAIAGYLWKKFGPRGTAGSMLRR